MAKFHITLILLLISSVALISCEQVEQMVQPVMPDMDSPDIMDIPDMTDPGEMMVGSPVVINEFMADNDKAVIDPQGDYDDWLELYNLTDAPIVLTGMYLSDKEDNPTKWEFPENTEIPANGYLIVWLDEDVEDTPNGLHTNFKLLKDGGMVMLVDTDAKGNQVLDSVTFGQQVDDVAVGRWPNGTGDFQAVVATPGAENRVE